LTAAIQTVCNDNLTRLQPFLRESGSSTKPTEFHIKVLDVCTRRFLLALDVPFADRNRTNPSYHYSRKIRMETAALLFPYPLPTLCGTEPTPTFDDNYIRFLLNIDGMFICVFNHASSNLCIELIDRLTDNTFPLTDRHYHEHLYRLIQNTIAVFERAMYQNQTTLNDYILFTCAAV
jgi:hypothetical protein